MKRTVLGLLLAVLAVAAVVVVRAKAVTSRQIEAPAAPPLEIDRPAALGRFVRAIQLRTISMSPIEAATPDPPPEHEAFLAFIAEAYPRVHALGRELVGGRSALFTWRGREPGLAPVLLMGHYDVVPVEPASARQWSHPPFGGDVADGFVWGRGTLDDKLSVIALLEAAESLLAEGQQPRRTLLLAFGHDEEIGGREGAAAIAKLLADRGARLEAVFDEGGVVTDGVVAGAAGPVALVGIAEKGMVSVELIARGPGGHSSMPPPRTEVGAIAAAVDRVQRRPFPAGVRGAVAQNLRWLAPEMPPLRRMVMSNLWLFEPLVVREARRSPSLDASLRTTIAPTMLAGGVKVNVIPTTASAVINFRILPGDTVAGVLEHVRQAVDDPHVELRLTGPAEEPSPVSDPDAPPFRALQRTIAQVYHEAVVAPYLTVGATDARHYLGLTRNVYRFIPCRVGPADLARFHGIDERVAVDDFFAAIRFYRALMSNVAE